MAGLRAPDCPVGRRPRRLDGRLMPPCVPDAVQRETLLRGAGTHCEMDGPRLSSAPRRKRGALRSVRGTHAAAGYSRVIRSRNALPTTLTDDSAIAAAAMMGDSSKPNAG